MGSGLSWARHSQYAIDEAVAACGQSLAENGGTECDLAIVTVSPHHVSSMGLVARTIARGLGARCVIGCSAEAVLGGSRELEGVAGISLLAASMPGVGFTVFTSEDLPSGLVGGGSGEGASTGHDDDDLADLADAVGMTPAHRGTLLFVEPYTTPLMGVLNGLARARALCSPGGAGVGGGTGSEVRGEASAGRGASSDLDAPIVGSTRRGAIIGGVCSAAARPSGNAMIANDQVVTRGVVGLSLAGQVRMDAVVSQGCRPIGPPLVVTSAKGQVIKTLAGKPAIDVVHAAISNLSESLRQRLLSRGLMIGRVVNEYKETFGPSDYLIRAVTGVSKDGGEILTSEEIRVGQTVRFHVRDSEAADADLGMLMDAQALHGRPAGMFLVTCNGRGTRLFPHADHDASTLQRAFRDPDPGEHKARGGAPIDPAGARPVPLAGFFGAGEIGPIGDGVFLHGQTACVAVFREG